MALNYRLEVATPATATANAKTWTFTADTGNVSTIETSLKRDQKRCSYLHAVIVDPGWTIFGALPDPAFANVPVRLYLGPDDSSSPPTTLVFDGKVTLFEAGYPEFESLTIEAHDNTIDLRRQKKYRTFKKKTSVQIAQAICKDYGITVTQDELITLTQLRTITIGMEISDWDHLCRELNFDGLEVYTKGKTLHIRLAANQVYATTFHKDSAPVVSLKARIPHVSGPGEGGDKKGAIALENAGTYAAAKGGDKTIDDKQGASERTHRRPVGAPAATSTGSHSEDPGNQGWTNNVVKSKRRKDELTLVCTVIDDIGLQHKAKLAGWGSKIDGEWFIDSIKHVLVGNSYGNTTLDLRRALSSGAAKSANLPPLT